MSDGKIDTTTMTSATSSITTTGNTTIEVTTTETIVTETQVQTEEVVETTTTTTTEEISAVVQALNAGKRKVIVEYGGQGIEYWQELKALYQQGGAVRAFIDLAADALYEESSTEQAKTSPAFELVLDLKTWLQESDDEATKEPQNVAWQRAFFSYALIALTQAANYVSFLTTAKVSHADVVKSASCAVGHSQGIVSAAVFATAKTDEEFSEISVRFVRYMFWHGLRAQETFLEIVAQQKKNVKVDKDATPMLAVRGLSKEHVLKAIEVANRRTKQNDLQLSLVNAPEMFCVTGLPATLLLLKQALEPLLAKPDENQTRVPFSQRKPTGALVFLNLTCPFHSALLAPAKEKILADAARVNVKLTGAQLQVPVYSTTTEATNLQSFGDADVLPQLVEMQLIQLADWASTLKTIRSSHSDATHVLDFGPDLGASRLSNTALEGLGIEVVVATSKYATFESSSRFPPIFGLSQFVDNVAISSSGAKSWEEKFAPRVDETGKLVNKFTRALKKPPVIVAGMTPTTSLEGVDLVAAIMNAGFYGELAAGGLSRPNVFEDTITELVSKVQPGHGIAINMLYLNAKQWGFQFPMVLRLRKSGVPIESITIGAGIPTKDRALEIMADLQAAGIKVIGFKPGSAEGIYSVIDIASANPSMNVMLQWTGGRAGGHHSFEDVHHPLVATYAAIRRVENILLVVGSGFGNWEDSHQYMTGEWSLSRGLLTKMPVDGILLGSRVMVAKEAATAQEVKQLLVDTPGIESELEWEQSYTGVVGGIVTVTSELGEPIHKVANRCSLLWKEFDDKYFSKPREELALAVRLDKDDIIARLNADFQKPYFGVKKDEESGDVRSADLEEMTYGEVLTRLIDLMYIDIEGRPQRWIHESFRDRVAKFMTRTEQRFRRKRNSKSFDQSELKTNPRNALRTFIEAYPLSISTLLSVSDCDYFLDLCRTGGKPVNFIPIIDSELRTWFKKDSLWYSEDLDAVPERDAQRVCILQGPVAVRYSTVVNEPVASILGGIADGFIKVASESGARSATSIASVQKPAEVSGFPVVENDGSFNVTVPADVSALPSASDWLAGLHSLTIDNEWLSSLISSEFVVESKKWIANPIRDLLKPQPNQTVSVGADGLKVVDKSVLLTGPVIQVFKQDAEIVVRVNELRPQITELTEGVVALDMKFNFVPESTWSIHSQDSDLTEKIKSFYARFWVAEEGKEDESCKQACEESVFSSFTNEFTVTADDVIKYKAALNLSGDEVAAPADFSTIVSWKSLIKSVFAKEVEGNLLNLVHLKHSYKLLTTEKANQLFAPGDEIVSVANVAGLRIIESGKIVSGIVLISRKTVSDQMVEALEPLVELRSEFLIRGKFSDFSSAFTVDDTVECITLTRKDDVQLLVSKPWLTVLPDAAPVVVGDILEFKLNTKKQYATMNELASVQVTGAVYRLESGATVHIGDVKVDSNSLNGCPVETFLRQIQPKPANKGSMLPGGGYNMLSTPIEIQVPANALAYAVASRDLNPIHRSNYAAILASLPKGKPIMHGMWTATKVRALVVEQFGSGVDTNVMEYDVNFDGMVYPGDKLYMQARHIGQNAGKKVLSVEIVNELGERVVSARAEVKQPPMAFVFTGQGSAEVNMGMERYQESPVAREIWNRGDAHLRDTFGFSILEMVRKNPKSITIHFGGKRGKKIRENFMKLTVEDPVNGGTAPLLPEITPRTQSFSFSAPEGLLFATQFSQPALVLLEKATFSEIEAAELIPEDALFAGHSLGEYAGLSSFAGALAVEDVAEVVFLRGLIMQKAVKRDESGRSDYGMVATNPSRIGDFFTEDTMYTLVDRISEVSGKLLQVVNFNVQDRQYVVAGENVNLEALSTSLSMFKSLKASANLESVVQEALAQAAAKKEKCIQSGKPFTLARGLATIPLPGIDVPFHSRELLGGVPSFRSLLRTKFSPDVLERQLPLLVNRYIPNLVATPFSLKRSYFEQVYEATKSPYIAEVLDPMQWNLTTKAQLVHLLVVELLAYQFASPVQWIKTQALLFSLNGTGVDRFVEIGPAPTLTNMALRTLQVGDFPDAPRQILWYKRDREVVHFEEESSNPSASEYARALAEAAAALEAPVVEAAAEPEVTVVAVAPPAAVHMPAPVVHAAPAAVEDAPVSALHILRVLLAIRLNKELSEISADTDVKTLCAGKSAVQNEILGDLEKEFGAGVPDGAGEIPLKELASKFSGYSALGKVTTGLISKMIAGKMPGGFTMSSVKEYLVGTKALGSGRIESVLAHSLLLAPQARLKSEAEARKWLDASVDSYASFAGVSLAAPVMNIPQAASGMTFAPASVSIPTVADSQVEAKHALKILLAAKFGKDLSEISDASTIKELSAGKSAVQNEIVGDLEKEFGSGPDDAAEMKISDLAGKFPGYASPGKVTSALIAKLLAAKMPGGFGLSAIKEYLSRERCLPAGRIESVLLHTLSQNPKQRLADEGQAKKWLDAVTDDYAKFSGIDIPYLSKLGMSAGAVSQQSMQTAALPTDFDKKLKAMIADQVEALNNYLGTESLDWHRRVETEVELREQMESSVSHWVSEHGEAYGNGIAPMFDARKERQYDSFWNWAVQDAMELYFRTILAAMGSDSAEKLPVSERLDEHFDAMSRWINKKVDTITEESARPPLEWFKPYLCNRATPELLKYTRYFVQRAEHEGRVEYSQAIQLLVEQVETWLQLNPVNVQIFEPMQPQLRILESGEMEYLEVPRTGVSDSIDYVDELARGLEYNDASQTTLYAGADATAEMASAVGFETTLNEGDSSDEDESDDDEDSDEAQVAGQEQQKAPAQVKPADGPKLNALRESLRKRGKKSPTRKSLVARSSHLRTGLNENLKQIVLPHIHIRKPSDVDPTIRLYDVESTCMLLACMREMASTGISFAGKVALVTGCGKNSIGAEVVKALLEGGATVFVTTSSFSSKTTATFRSIYEQHGSRGSRLVIVPFNQASKNDVEKLVAHIYNVHKLDLDFVVPFAALSEVGRTIADIDARSELAHRIMLTNTMRLLGEIVSAKKSRGISTRPALAVLPLSPNHGNFGGDGLYAESKLGVESLMNKWYSEGWDDQLSIVGAVIGWTRGTGLMSGNNIVAQGVEKLGVRTFSTTEMGFNLSALLHPNIVDKAAEAPLWADLTGGMAQLADLKNQVDTIRTKITSEAKLQASIYQSIQNEKKLLALPSVATAEQQPAFTPRADLSGYFCDGFPGLSSVGRLASTREQTLLRDMLDLRKVVVVAGYGEVGPWGSARTRWEMESFGEFSLEGCIELAWLTGHIVYDNGNWVDAKTKEIIPDSEVKSRYEEEIIKHSGIRIVEPDLFEGYDPHKKMILHQVAIDKKMAPVEVADREEALQFRSELGEENVDVFQNASGAWMIRLRKGSVLSIPRALSFDRFVAGQIPTGWSAERLGLPKDIAESVDPVTLYTLASTMDALVSAGVTDPYEFYQYVHVSEIGNTSGGGMGGMRSFKRIYQGRLQGKSVASDTLQECFINTAPAWVNMLLLSSSGPIKTPVGACATAAESVDIGVETIKSGKARIVIVGGYDDFGEEGSYEFAQMKATSDSVKETGMGRDPKEMCRPCSTTRGGFMESQGAGMQLLMDAQLALDMGCPIYGIVALTNTATDKNGRSVPAPGQGILTTAREASSKPSPLLDVEFRRRQFDAEVADVETWFSREKALVSEDNAESHLAFLDEMKARKLQSAQAMWGEGFYLGRADIAPLRGALGVWNLTVDDIGVASFHGTGTKANDKNESEVTQKQLQHLGRSVGNPLPIICQKNMTGHPKGAAAAWMFNGLLQVLNSGLIPGNRNLDNTCETLRKFDYLMYPNRSIQTVGIKAAVMKSFGFGQAGGEILLVHPDYLLSTLAQGDLQSYTSRRSKRLTRMNTYMQNTVTGKHSFIQVKDSAPYSASQESSVYLDPTSRAQYDPVVKSWRFGGSDQDRRPRAPKRAKKTKSFVISSTSKTVDEESGSDPSTLESALNQTASDIGLTARNIGIGVDVEPVATFENLHGREDFIRRNFTDQEMAYCYSAPHPAASFAGRWAAKEAVIKAISSTSPNEPNVWKGAGAPLREIEIFMTASGAPSVLLSGYPLQVFNRIGLTSLSVSISHSGDYAVSQAVANFQS
uniref:Fatty acid synthase subunit alpha n=1 Tax=Globisporangium ultimum (strain ATCC 200006 / CBS 805.95 / DAOM BR144) TaxID=431595 RepID=K3WEQ6_GLOUD